MPKDKKGGTPDWSFQEDAITKVVQDFRAVPTSKNLLVIPTGGGKTFTAMRVVNRMLQDGLLTDKDRVMWVVHRLQLKKQAEDDLKELVTVNRTKFDINKNLQKVIDVEMIAAANDLLRKDKIGKIKLLIIDEAHHAAANSYKEFFNFPIGILGLTATPTRNDDSELDFDKVSYSITFRDLIKKNVVLEPKFEKVETGRTITISTLDYEHNGGELDKSFNSESRNRFIADEIFKRKDFYKKVIVFVSSTKHAKDLYEIIKIKNTFLNEPYKHVGYIYGDDNNEKYIENSNYLKWHKNQQSSILINCQLLNEGYDDPSINAVVMAVPTRSILYYMQCVGRVVRNPGEADGKAYVLEFDDNLPNIKYRIDNKWLYADISDVLEPIVIECDCTDERNYIENVEAILNEHHVSKEYFSKIPNKIDLEKVSLLLLQPRSIFTESSPWIPMFLEPKNRQVYTRLYNSLSETKDLEKPLDFLVRRTNIDLNSDDYFQMPAFKSDFIETLRKARSDVTNKIVNKRIKYVNFLLREQISLDFIDFIKGCHNQAALQEEYRNHIENKTAVYILKFPLMLGFYEGYYCTFEIYDFCKQFIQAIQEIKVNIAPESQDQALYENLSLINNVPLPLKYLQSLMLIVRDDLKDYFYKL